VEAGPQIDDDVHRALGLTDEERDRIITILGRRPNHLELAMYSVMWSEHCSYKSSRVHLGRLPTQAPWVLVGPGENAGVVDVGDGIAAAIRIESHNHPSAIEPYQGAATGVGGILRDIFTMGARPIALMDPLRFGPLEDPRSRWIAEGVVSGVSGYGNAVGVPTVGGEVVFDATYEGNPLVNVLCLGLLPVDRLVLGRATGVGNQAVLLGSSTGRDGIGGVSVLASAGFGDTEADAAKRPNVQVGDPFEEKRLIEACLALLDAGLVVGIQDLGGAGLCCATSEMASRGGVGMDVDVSAVALRQPGLEPFEIMTSESQERMLAVVQPADLDEVLELCRRWEVRAQVVGRVTEGGALRILDGDVVAGEVPAASLHEDAPLYHRPLRPRERAGERDPATLDAPADGATDLLAMLADPAWVWGQYDHQLFLNTVAGPGGDATVLRLKHPVTGVDTGRALALTTDGNRRWCAVAPRTGTARVVAESVLNLACVGARPLALVNCLNFGNPEHPEVMWELSEAIDGMAEACRAFDLPVVGGNVSLYNETRGRDIDPSPVVGVLGMVDALERRPPGRRLVPGGRLLVLGPDGAADLAGSRWAWQRDAKGGALPALDLPSVANLAALVRQLVGDDLLLGLHDLADGGLALAIAEMVAAFEVGAELATAADHVALFGESPDRVVVCVEPGRVETVLSRAAAAGVAAREVGGAGGDRLRLGPLVDVAVADVVGTWRGRLPTVFGTAVTH
jgi:phosphoribosylformylglycinamidine synthase subunit PurL